MFRDIKVGDELYLISREPGKTVTVLKKGRTWFYTDHYPFSNCRFSIATGFMDSGYSRTDRCYRTKEDYEDSRIRNAMWDEIKRWFSRSGNNARDTMTKEQMYEIAKIVGLEFDKNIDNAFK